MLAQTPRTRWGGVAGGASEPTGFFRLSEQDGVFWLTDPDGGRFISKGVDTVRFDQDPIQGSDRVPYAQACQRKYGSLDAWRAGAARRLFGWGFNTLGAWSDEAVAAAAGAPLAVAPIIDLGMSFAWGHRPGQDFPDLFDPAFDQHVRRRAQELCGPRREDQGILGWFIDNELRWGPDWRGAEELIALFLSLPPASVGRIATFAWLKSRHSDFARFNVVWRTAAASWDEVASLPRVVAPYQRRPPYQRDDAAERALNLTDLSRAAFAADCDAFLELIAERYFAATSAAIRAADPHHLILGSRFAFVPPPAVIEAAARHCDVISFNCYGLEAGAAIDAYAATGKPCLIGEFSFRGIDSGLPNSNGAGPVVASQIERAACFRRYVTEALSKPALVGYHWFEHADQPAEGRFDGENSNFGTVRIDDTVYEELTRQMAIVNAEAEALHAAAVLVG
jgi:agarase